MKKRIVALAVMAVLTFGLTATVYAETEAGTEKTGAAAEDEEIETADKAGIDKWDPETEEDRALLADVEEEAGELPSAEGLRFAAVVNEASNEFWATIGKAMEDRCAELGIEFEIYYSPSTNDAEGQMQAMEGFMMKDFDAYLLSPMTEEQFVETCEQLRAEGKVTVNPYIYAIASADCYVGCMDSAIAKMAAQEIIEQTGGKGKVAVAMGSVGTLMNYYRCTVFKDYIEANSDIEVVQEMPCEWLPDNAKQMTEDLLTTTPDIDFIWCANDTVASGVIEGVRTHDMIGQVKVLAMDGTSGGIKAVADGEQYGTYNGDPTLMGRVSVDAAVRLCNGQDLPRVIETPVTLIDADNVADYQ